MFGPAFENAGGFHLDAVHAELQEAIGNKNYDENQAGIAMVYRSQLPYQSDHGYFKYLTVFKPVVAKRGYEDALKILQAAPSSFYFAANDNSAIEYSYTDATPELGQIRALSAREIIGKKIQKEVNERRRKWKKNFVYGNWELADAAYSTTRSGNHLLAKMPFTAENEATAKRRRDFLANEVQRRRKYINGIDHVRPNGSNGSFYEYPGNMPWDDDLAAEQGVLNPTLHNTVNTSKAFHDDEI